MKTKTILGISLTAAFAMTMIFSQNVSAGVEPTHLDITKARINVEDDGDIQARITTATNIPLDGTMGAYGYGLITDTFDHDMDAMTDEVPENVLAFTTHMCAADSLIQGDIVDSTCPGGDSIGVLEFLEANVEYLGLPDDVMDTEHDGPEMHPHILDLVGVVSTSNCSTVIGSMVEVDVGRSLASQNNLSPGDYDLRVHKNKLTAKNIPVDDANVHDTDLLAYASFNIVPKHVDGTITNLCLTDLTVTPLS